MDNKSVHRSLKVEQDKQKIEMNEIKLNIDQSKVIESILSELEAVREDRTLLQKVTQAK